MIYETNIYTGIYIYIYVLNWKLCPLGQTLQSRCGWEVLVEHWLHFLIKAMTEPQEVKRLSAAICCVWKVLARLKVAASLPEDICSMVIKHTLNQGRCVDKTTGLQSGEELCVKDFLDNSSYKVAASKCFSQVWHWVYNCHSVFFLVCRWLTVRNLLYFLYKWARARAQLLMLVAHSTGHVITGWLRALFCIIVLSMNE